jgi:heat shock protein HslJ
MRRLILVVAACALTSCNGGNTEPSAAALTILGNWDLRSIQVASDVITVSGDPGRYTAEFGADGRLSVRSDCNRCASGYSTSGMALEVGAMACTRAYCGDESHDDDYVSALAGATAFDRAGSTLVVRHGGGALRFEALP